MKKVMVRTRNGRRKLVPRESRLYAPATVRLVVTRRQMKYLVRAARLLAGETLRAMPHDEQEGRRLIERLRTAWRGRR
jgi:hypothetical protein